MADTQEIVEAYGAAWNEPDEAERRRLLERSWANDGVFVDPQSHAEGREALLGLIADFQRQLSGAQIVTTSGIDVHHNVVRFTWAVRGADGSTMMEGIDFGELAEDGRLRKIVGFWGPPPAAAGS